MDPDDDLIPGGPVAGWRLMGGGCLVSETPSLFARFAPEAIAWFLDPAARNFSHRAWSWVHGLAEPLPSFCLVDDSHDVTPAPDCGCGWRVVTDFDDMTGYLRRMAGKGDHFVLARVETVGTLRASHARENADPSRPLDDPPSTVRAAAIRVTDLFLHQDVHDKPAYGSPAAWLKQFGSDAQVHVPPEPRRVMWRPRRDGPEALNYVEYLGLEQWLDWVAEDWERRAR